MKYFGTDGIRGVFGKDLTLELVEQVANAVALQNPKRVVIGHDTRGSCGAITDTFTKVLKPCGVHIVNIGVVPTTACAFLTSKLKADIGIMITASHNPHTDNGIKLFNALGEKMDGAELEYIDSLIQPRSIWEDFLFAKFAPSFADKQLPRVAIDFANGSGANVALSVLKRLGFDVVACNNNPDGQNINLNCGAVHPDTGSLSKANADICFSFDGDADRCMTLGSDGKLISTDVVLAVLSKYLGVKTLVSTTMFNGGVEQYLESQNIKLVRTNVGDRFVFAELKKHKGGKIIGGEPSGHIIFPDILMAGDGFLCALVILEMVVATGKSIAELTAGIPLWKSILVNTAQDIPAGESVRDGCRVLIRKSGTEKVTRIYIEGETEEQCQATLKKIL